MSEVRENLKDITTRDDVKVLVDSFYDKVNKDELLSPVFNDHVKIDWEHHLPTMYDFWTSVLFGTMEYKGRPFPKHMGLPVSREHFGRWLELFTKTIDEHFDGPIAQDTKVRAMNIATMFQYKMGLIKID